jgi:hypothetical protein
MVTVTVFARVIHVVPEEGDVVHRWFLDPPAELTGASG